MAYIGIPYIAMAHIVMVYRQVLDSYGSYDLLIMASIVMT